MDRFTQPSLVKELHRDLARKYRNLGPKIEQIWSTLGQTYRVKAMRAGAAEGVVLKHSLDSSLGSVCKFMPEYNLRDITAEGSDFFLDLLKHRATTTLEEQYISGFNGGSGDHQLIMQMVRTRNLRHTDSFKDCYTFFVDGDRYGESIRIMQDHEWTLAAFAPAINAGMCVPQAIGELVLLRQLYLLQSLNIMVEDVLEIGSTTRSQERRPKRSTDAGLAALSKLSIQPPQPTQPKLDFSDLRGSASDQKAALQDELQLICLEPVALTHAVNIWFFSRPELVPDDMGRILPAHTDKYVSAAVLDAVHNAVKGGAIWEYMDRLLGLLESTTDKSHRTIILQQIANLCHLEFTRAQGLLKRHISTGTGSKWFKRVSNGQTSGNTRVNLKANTDSLIIEKPQLHYMLRLCAADTNPSKAIDYLKRLDEIQIAHQSDGMGLQEREVDALADLAIVTSFIHSLSPIISMPSFNRKKGQFFILRAAQLEAELDRVKTELDLADFAVPIDNLLEPGMAEGALKALDNFITDKAGTKIGFLYQDMTEECLAQIQAQLKAKTGNQEYVPFTAESAQAAEVRVQLRREKEKTRPARSSTYEITPEAQRVASESDEEDVRTTSPPLKVKSTSHKVFSALFSKSESRGSIA